MPSAGAEPATPAPPLPHRMLLYVSSVEGGITHCCHYQAEELQARGVDVTMLCGKAYPWQQDQVSYRQLRRFPRIVGKGFTARLRRFLAVLGNHWRLAWHVARERPDVVLLEANTEYFSLLWIWPHLLLRALGVTYIANFHDPVRKVRYGMPRLHGLELALFYRILRGGLIHGEVPAEAWIPRWIALEVVPHGPFPHLASQPVPFDLRERLGIGPDRFVLLSFGLVTDYKNLDLLIEAAARVEGVDLVIAGKVKSSGERTIASYRDAAALHGVADRVHFVEGFIPEAEIPAYFNAADAVALTYQREFVSQSGVLQLAVIWQKQVLASSGPGPLQDAVSRFDLGIFVEPDSVDSATKGLESLRFSPRDRRENFNRYDAETAWSANIDGLARLLNRVR